MNSKLNISSKKVTVFGGSGFIGRYVVSLLLKSGYLVRVAVRNTNDALFIKTLGQVGQVELFECDILDPRQVSLALNGSKFAINCVAGDLYETNIKKMRKIYVDGPVNIANQVKAFNLEKLIHLSSLGADITSDSYYFSLKAEGETKITDIFNKTVILRPSIVFGVEDKFFNNFASMSVISPFIPVISGNTLFQPIYVGDVAKCVFSFLKNNKVGTFEISGPEKFSFRQLVEKMLKIVRRKKVIIDLPIVLAKALAIQFYFLKIITFGFLSPKITIDNIKQLQKDNIKSLGKEDETLFDFDFATVDSILPSYLYQYRPYGQYSDIKDSAKDLKNE